MNLISTLIGIVALVAALIAFIPLLGWLNWLVIPVVVIGLVLGLFSDKTTGRNINLVVLAIAMFRLFMGGGILLIKVSLIIRRPWNSWPGGEAAGGFRALASRARNDSYGHVLSCLAQTFSTQPRPNSVSTSTHEPRHDRRRFTAI
jgi:hypothetical protein